MNKAADSARSYDTNKTKEAGHHYVLKDESLNPPIDRYKNKLNHGTNHPQILRAIVPMSLLYKHGKDAE